MKFCVIGNGSIGRRHAKNLTWIGHDVVSYDKDPNRSEVLELPWGDVDGVLICTPPTDHWHYIEIALAHKVHVFIEKPIFDRSCSWEPPANYPRVIMPATNYRFHPAIKRLKELVEQDGFYSINVVYGHAIESQRPDWRSTYLSDIDPLLDSGIHMVDYCAYITGQWPVESMKLKRNIFMRWPVDSLAHVHVDWTQPIKIHSVQVIGDGWHHTEWIGHYDMHMDQIKHFCDCCEGKAEPIATCEDALKALSIVA